MQEEINRADSQLEHDSINLQNKIQNFNENLKIIKS